jgi:hypothetical protein
MALLRLLVLYAASLALPLFTCPSASAAEHSKASLPAKIYISFHWHMHQPIYWPYESVRESEERNRYSFSLLDIFAQRQGPYTSWPRDALESAVRANLPHAGAQLSISGSLIENLNNLYGPSWASDYAAAHNWKTTLGHPRLDLVAFGYHHPMMPLISYANIREQIARHRDLVRKTFGPTTTPSKGIFPPENAFADWMIPALVDEGLQWVMVDNIHLNRATQGYPWTKGENLVPPNPAEQRNPPLAGNQWIQLNGVWAPSKVSAWAERPHWVVARDPKTGAIATTPEGKPAKMIAIPTERYLGNEDGRGGFGALNYEHVMSQFERLNTDAEHPVFLVLHHDGDNYGGGAESYYHHNFERFIEWLQANPERFEFTSVQDYLNRFPPADDDIVHAEPGSWSGADNGDPEFKKWFGDPVNGYSPDRNSWSVLTAAENILQTAITRGVSQSKLSEARRWQMVAQTSCYEYWDGQEPWDSHPTRAANEVAALLTPLLDGANDRTAPTILLPQREPYNPGGLEWSTTPEPPDFDVWTYAHDISGIKSATLFYRVLPGIKFPASPAHFSTSSGEWIRLEMAPQPAVASQTTPAPLEKATEYRATITGTRDALVSYRVVATDQHNNASSSIVQHVYVGRGETPASGFGYTPATPSAASEIVLYSPRPGKLHWGVNGWKQPIAPYRPGGTTAWPDGKAVQTTLTLNQTTQRYEARIGPFSRPDQQVNELDFIFYFNDGGWGPHDYKVNILP